MATTLGPTGITFPDSTVQTTASSGGIPYRTRVIYSGSSYTPAADVKHFLACVYGATGGTSTASNTYTGGAGGAGYSEKYYATPTGSYSLSIGAAGGAGGTSGGTTTFDTISVTSSAGRAAGVAAGGPGGVGSGGDFNATGGTGGPAGSTAAGGGGGSASRAGNGGNGYTANGAIGGPGGGTGGNNAADKVPGAAATTEAAGVYPLPYLSNVSSLFEAGQYGGITKDGNYGAGGSQRSLFINAPISFVDDLNYYQNPTFGRGTRGSFSSFGTVSTLGTVGIIFIVEFL